MSVLILAMTATVAKGVPSNTERAEGEAPIVANRGEGLWGDTITDRIRFTETLSIGSEHGQPHEMLWNPRALAVDSAMNIYLLDAVRSERANAVGACRVMKFDREGRFLWSRGQRGEGPGEFINPSDVLISPSGELVVVETLGYKKCRLQYFDTELEYRRSATIAEQMRSVSFLSDGSLLVSEWVKGQPGISGHYYSAEGEFLRSFPDDYRYGPLLPEGCGLDGGVFHAQEGRVYMVTPDAYEIREYREDGSRVRTIRRDVKLAPAKFKITGDRAGYDPGDGCGPCYSYKDSYLLNFRFIRRGHGGGDLFLDLFDREGVFLGSYQNPGVSGLVTIDNEGNFYCLVNDPDPRMLRHAMEVVGTP